MIYLLSGTDSFRKQERIRQICGDRQTTAPELLRVYLPSDTTLAELQNALSAQSLLPTHQVVVGDDLFNKGTAEMQQWLKHWLARSSTAEVTVILAESTSVSAISKGLSPRADFVIEDYPPLTAREVKRWLDQRANSWQVKLSTAVAQELIANFGNDLWRLQQELDKLALFVGRDQTINQAVFNELVRPTWPDNLFRAIDALADKDFRAANLLLNMQLAGGTDETELLAMMAYQFRSMALVKALQPAKLSSDEMVAKTGLHPFVVKKSGQFAGAFSWPQLQRVFYLLQKVDRAIKQNQLPPKIGVDILTAQIAIL